MSGQEVKRKLEMAGVSMSEIARNLRITPQSLYEKLNVNDIKVGVLSDIARASGLTVGFFIDNGNELKGSSLEEPLMPYGTVKKGSITPVEDYSQILKAKDETIFALRKALAAYERLLNKEAHSHE